MISNQQNELCMQKTTDMTFKQLIIFDLDGTLIDSVPDLAFAINQMLNELNLMPLPTKTIKNWVGNGSLKLVERALGFYGNQDPSQVLLAHEHFLAAYANCAIKHTTAYDGVIDGLSQLVQAGYRLAVCTNKPVRYLPEILSHFGWQDIFEMVLGGDSLPSKKPSPIPLLHICDTLGVAPSAAIMVGDSKNDILAGKAAGMTTLALRYGYNYHEPIDLSSPDAAFDDFGTLVQSLLNWQPTAHAT